jgi:hypothetical protein
MKPGDLVVGRTVEQFGMKIEPISGSIGMVIDLDPSTLSARVLYKERVYTYFQSELRVLDETDGENQDRVLQG